MASNRLAYACLGALCCFVSCSSSDPSPSRIPRRILFSHDGGIDDYLALQILATHAMNDIVGIAVTAADSFLDPAVNATAKILDLVSGRFGVAPRTSGGKEGGDKGHLPHIFAISGARPAHSSFPDAFRSGSITIEMLPVLNEQYFYRQDDESGKELSFLDLVVRPVHGSSPAADRLGGRALALEADAVFQHLCGTESVNGTTRSSVGGDATWVEVGPLTLLAQIVQRHPGALGPPGSGACITSIYWMGGALRVGGNVSPFLISPSSSTAEWNVFWDPPAASFVLQMASDAGVKSFMVPLDGTNSVPITRDFLLTLSQRAAYFRKKAWEESFKSDSSDQSFRAKMTHCASMAELAGSAYARAYRGHDRSYNMWDVFTITSYLAPHLVRTESVHVTVNVGSGPESGRTEVCSSENEELQLPHHNKCSKVEIVTHIESLDDVYDFARDSLIGLCDYGSGSCAHHLSA